MLEGGSRSDAFVFRGGFGHDIIGDFNALAGANHDVIQFSEALSGSFAEIQAKMTQVGADVVIKVTAADTLVLESVNLANVTADDFGFVA